jgi:hypothetical protein
MKTKNKTAALNRSATSLYNCLEKFESDTLAENVTGGLSVGEYLFP